MSKHRVVIAAFWIAAVAGCGGSSGGGSSPTDGTSCTNDLSCPARQYCSSGSCVALPTGQCRKSADCASDETCSSNVCEAPTVAECDKAANLARKATLTAAQPVLSVRTKSIITATTTFASVAGDPLTVCTSAPLQFRDLNGSGTLEPYEDWTRPAQVRTADLVARMTLTEKGALLAHATVADVPSSGSTAPSAATEALIDAGIRFGRTSANGSNLTPRATWANNVQQRCEASRLGIPFVLSTDPAHAPGLGRTKAQGFSQWPHELSLAVGGAAIIEQFAKIAAQEYRAIGIRMALSPSADLATEPRWWRAPYTFGEGSAQVSARVAAYVQGFQGATLGPTSVACVVGHFPGAGAAEGGWDARLSKGKYTVYPGNALDAHLGAFQGAFASGVAGVMTGYAIPKTGTWTGLGGLVDGATVEQVGASFSPTLVTTVLRGHYGYSGLVVAPWGVLNDAGLSPLGAPWGVEGLTPAQRLAKAVAAGVDQFGGLNDTTVIDAARTGGLVTEARIDASAGRALSLMFQLGLFENPYVDPAQAPALCNTDLAKQRAFGAGDAGMVLIVNAQKPAGWLDGQGDGTQAGDPGNAGNGTMKVLPAPPGRPYIAAGCNYYVAGNFNLEYVRGVSTGYGTLTNDVSSIGGTPATTDAQKMALSDYIFIRIAPPSSVDPDSGALALPLPSLEYAGADNASELAPVAAARAAIDAWNLAHPSTPSKAQIIVGVDGGRPSAVSEITSYGVSGLFMAWGVTDTSQPDKAWLDTAFGVAEGTGRLPVGVPRSNAVVQDPAQQRTDLAGDGQDPIFVTGFGFDIPKF